MAVHSYVSSFCWLFPSTPTPCPRLPRAHSQGFPTKGWAGLGMALQSAYFLLPGQSPGELHQK